MARARMRAAGRGIRRGTGPGRGGKTWRATAKGFDGHNAPSAADLGIRRDEIHEARQFRDAQRPDPGMRRAKGGIRRATGEGLGEFFEVSSNINILYILNGGGNATGVGPSLAFDKLPGA